MQLPRTERIAVDDGELFVAQRGEGPPVLLIHGFPLDHAMWRHQLDGLADGWRLVAPDLRGFGQSTVTEGTLTMARLADDLACLLEKLAVEGPLVLCGLSMGGYVAWEFWRRHPRRVAALILCDTRAAADAPKAAADRLATADRVLAEGPNFLADAMIPRLFAPATAARHPALVEEVRRVILGTAPQGIAAALRGMAKRADATAWLNKIDVRGLLLCGEHDAISHPDEMAGIAQAMPDARFATIPHAGHMAPLEQPALVNDAIREFLRSL